MAGRLQPQSGCNGEGKRGDCNHRVVAIERVKGKRDTRCMQRRSFFTLVFATTLWLQNDEGLL